jgi:hypothetical protein
MANSGMILILEPLLLLAKPPVRVHRCSLVLNLLTQVSSMIATKEDQTRNMKPMAEYRLFNVT